MTTGFNTKLPFGNYYVRETSTDEHYVVDEIKYPVEFSYAGQETSVQEIAVNDGAAIENILKKGRINGLKTDADDGTVLEGAVIGIFSNSETEFTEKNAIDTVISDKNGKFSFEDVVFRTISDCRNRISGRIRTYGRSISGNDFKGRRNNFSRDRK